MGDMADSFNALKQYNKDRRADNTKANTETLKLAGVVFESKNYGAHLIIQGAKGKADFWPSTGKWRDRNNRWHGRGTIGLLERLKQGDL